MAQSEIHRATKIENPLKNEPTNRLEPANNRRSVKKRAATAGRFSFIDIMAHLENKTEPAKSSAK